MEDLSKIKAIFFDFWGVMANFDAPVNRAVGIKNPATDSPEYYKLISKHNLGQISEEEFLAATGKLFNIELTAGHRYLFDADHLNHGLIDIIKKLKSKYKTGLITNTGKEYMDEFLFKPGLDKLFDYLIISHAEGLKKPDPKIYQLAVERSGFQPNEILYLDDHPDRITPASNIGIQTMLYEGAKTDEILKSLC